MLPSDVLISRRLDGRDVQATCLPPRSDKLLRAKAEVRDDDGWARMLLNSDGLDPLISMAICNVVGDLLMEFMGTRNILRVSETCLSAVRLNLV